MDASTAYLIFKKPNRSVWIGFPELIRNHPLGCFGSAIWSTSTNQPSPKKGLPPQNLIYHLKSSLPNRKGVSTTPFFRGYVKLRPSTEVCRTSISDIGSYFSNQISDFFAPHVFFGSFSRIKNENTTFLFFFGDILGCQGSLFFHGYREGFSQTMKKKGPLLV